jgi:hypothetical protein
VQRRATTGPPQAGSPPGTASPAEISDKRVRELYAQFVDTRRRLGETTANITFDSVARSLRTSMSKLRKEHGRAVDFEVIVKDGKTMIRPLIR